MKCTDVILPNVHVFLKVYSKYAGHLVFSAGIFDMQGGVFNYNL